MRRLALALSVLVATPLAAQDVPPPAPPPAASAPAASAPAAPPPPQWLPRQAGELVLLDKVAAQTATLSLTVGQSGRFGSLTITLGACEVRPPDMPEASTAWLDITDADPGAPAFHGWIVSDAPAVSGLQHPSYDVRLAGCR